jgi:hypothetical protein
MATSLRGAALVAMMETVHLRDRDDAPFSRLRLHGKRTFW